jgi:hypothetical protein
VIRNGTFALWAAMTVLAQPVQARQCPAPAEFDRILRCVDAVADPADAEHCAGRWKDLGYVWNCLLSDPAYKNLPLSAIAPRQASPPAPIPCDTISLAKRKLAEDYEQGKLVDPKLLFGVIEGEQALMGCPPPPPQQTTTCIPLDSGAFTCTTK